MNSINTKEYPWADALESPTPPSDLAKVNGPECSLRYVFKADPNGSISTVTLGSISGDMDVMDVFESQFLKLDLREHKLFVFDCDGLLVDSEKVTLECIIEAAQQIVRENNNNPHFVFSLEEVELIKQECFKRPEPDMAGRLKLALSGMKLVDEEVSDQSDSDFLNELIERRLQIYSDKVDQGQIKLMPGAIELLKQLNKFNATCAIYTGNSDKFIKILLEKLIEPHIPDFALFIPHNSRFYGSALPAGLTKPNGFACLQVCQRLGIDPKRAVMFEDRLSGVVSAFSAGYGLSVIIPENQDIRPFSELNNPLSIPNLLPLYGDWEKSFRDPNRFQILSGLDRICLIGPDGQEWFPEAYYKQKEHWISFSR